MEKDRRFYTRLLNVESVTFCNTLSQALQRQFLYLDDQIPKNCTDSDAQRSFDARFYALGYTAVIARWAQEEMQISAEELSARLIHMAESSERVSYYRNIENRQI